MNLKVSLFFVDITGCSVDPSFYACGDATFAGPFMSGGSAIEWRDEFCPDGDISQRWSDEPGVCQQSGLEKGLNGWARL